MASPLAGFERSSSVIEHHHRAADGMACQSDGVLETRVTAEQAPNAAAAIVLCRKKVFERRFNGGNRLKEGSSMVGVLPELTAADWAIITAVVLVPVLMALGIYAIRSEMREAIRIKAKSVKLKTSRDKRRKLRKVATSEDMIDLLDDVEALLRFINADDVFARQEHQEAVRLSWMSFHIPIGVALIGSALLAGVLSAALMVVAQGPSNPIP